MIRIPCKVTLGGREQIQSLKCCAQLRLLSMIWMMGRGLENHQLCCSYMLSVNVCFLSSKALLLQLNWSVVGGVMTAEAAGTLR